MSVERQLASLLRVANEDLRGARLLAGGGNRNAIYLCAQAAEKIIKAVLTSEGKHAGIKHELGEMVQQVPDANPLRPALRDVEHLSAYLTAWRYPTTSGRISESPGGERLQEAIGRVAALLDAVVARFKVDLSSTDSPAGTTAPIR
jgi:HEPN domain-containing protein